MQPKSIIQTTECKQLSLDDWMRSVASQFGYFGVFIISVIGSMSIIVPIPYTIVILYLGMQGWSPLLLTLSGGFGSAMGEFAGYLLGYYGRRIVSSERQRKMDYLLKLFGKWSPVAVFIFALTPLPDDLLFIPLGILRYNPLKAFLPALAGKLIMCYVLASFGKVYGDALSVLFGNESWIGAVVTAVLLVLAIYVLYRVDWEKVFYKHVSSKVAEDDSR